MTFSFSLGLSEKIRTTLMPQTLFLLILLLPFLSSCDTDGLGSHQRQALSLSESSEKRINLHSFVSFKFRDSVASRDCTEDLLQKLDATAWYETELVGSSLRIPRIGEGNWLKIKIKNESDKIQERVLTIPTINLPVVEVCNLHLERGEIETGYSGYKTERVFQVFLSDFPHFNINIRPRETIVLYININSFQDINFPLLLVSGKEYKALVFYRFLLFLSLTMLALIFLGWGIFKYRNSGHLVYIAVAIHYCAYYLLEYFLYGKEIASLFGNQFDFIRYSYFVFISLHHFAFFFYVRAWEIYRGTSIHRSVLFRLAFISGVLYLLVPSNDLIYENRIFILLANFGALIFYFYATHRALREISVWRDQFYFFSWLTFLLAVFYKLLFYFDFYPFHSFTQYASIFSLPVISFAAFLILEFLELEKKRTEKRSTLVGVDLEDVCQKLEELLELEKLYLNEDLSEVDVANRLGLGLHQVSELINTRYEVSLPGLLNRYRVNEAKKNLIEKKDIPVNDIAKISGFGSRSAFYLEFKKQTGLGPSEYRRQNR